MPQDLQPNTPEAVAWLAERRALINAGVPVSKEDLRKSLELLRAGRVRAQEASTKSRTAKAAKAKPVDSNDLLSQLDGL